MTIQERSQPLTETNSSINPLNSMQADHVFIGVDDYEKIKHWYIEKLDFTVDLEWTVDELPGMKLGYLRKDDFRIELIGDEQGSRIPIPTGFAEHLKNKGFQHLAFRVDSVNAVMAELETRGVDAFVPAASYPNIGRRVSFIKDPEGNVIEFVEYLA
jgi:catechol 2,3-dioxygenase-like lactoylglutathione lyase family enzyme